MTSISYTLGPEGSRTVIFVEGLPTMTLTRPQWIALASEVVSQFGGTLEQFQGFRIIGGDDVRDKPSRPEKPTLPPNTLERLTFFGLQIGTRCESCNRVHWRYR